MVFPEEPERTHVLLGFPLCVKSEFGSALYNTSNYESSFSTCSMLNDLRFFEKQLVLLLGI